MLSLVFLLEVLALPVISLINSKYSIAMYELEVTRDKKGKHE